MKTHLLLLGYAMLQPLLWWLVIVGGATFSGYPGAVFMTPLAWLAFSLWVGITYKAQAQDQGVRPRWYWAAAGGAILGLILGLIFTIVVLVWMPVEANRPDEMEKAINVIKFMIVAGCIVCPLISMLSSISRTEI
ncbi:MAG: hypothetical protein KME16_04565 [Scytolyngbya sp. HA4215-MV1]|jgi:cytochrome bd-type quinol oxidase subunit 2|nr:hypothetical protein [Scytolyngbya sp. HA4215-MV1]